MTSEKYTYNAMSCCIVSNISCLIELVLSSSEIICKITQTCFGNSLSRGRRKRKLSNSFLKIN